MQTTDKYLTESKPNENYRVKNLAESKPNENYRVKNLA